MSGTGQKVCGGGWVVVETNYSVKLKLKLNKIGHTAVQWRCNQLIELRSMCLFIDHTDTNIFIWLHIKPLLIIGLD